MVMMAQMLMVIAIMTMMVLVIITMMMAHVRQLPYNEEEDFEIVSKLNFIWRLEKQVAQ